MWSLEMLKCTHFFHNKYCNQNATQSSCFVPYVSLTSGLLVGKQLCLIWNIVQNKFLLCDWALCSDGAAAGASITEIINSWSHCEQEQYHMPNTNRILANNISQYWLHMCVNLRRKQPSGVYRRVPLDDSETSHQWELIKYTCLGLSSGLVARQYFYSSILIIQVGLHLYTIHMEKIQSLKESSQPVLYSPLRPSVQFLWQCPLMSGINSFVRFIAFNIQLK